MTECEEMTFDHIAVVGGGAWGTALALTCARAGRKVTCGNPIPPIRALPPNAREPVFARRAARRPHRLGRRPRRSRRADAILLVVPAQAVRTVATRRWRR